MAGYGGGGDYGGGGGYFGGDNPMGGYGGNNGGGFGSPGGKNQPGNSQSPQDGGRRGGGGGGRNRENQTVVPLTIAQLLASRPDSADGKFFVDGHELYHVKICGFVRELIPHSTRTQYIIEDSTGTINATSFSEDNETDEEQERKSQIQENTYVKLIVQPRTYKDEFSALVLSIRPMTDFNELTLHYIDAIHTHAYRVNGPRNQKGGGQGVWNGGGGTNNAFGGGASAGGYNNNGGGGGGMGGGENDVTGGSFTAVQQATLNMFSSEMVTDNEMGLHMQVVVSELAPQGFRQQDVVEAINFLAQEGHLYSTVDEQHWMTTAQ